MENNKFWIYLGLGVVAALSLKWFNSADSVTTSKRWSLQAQMAEEIQYQRSAKTPSRVAELAGPRRSTVAVQAKSGTTTAAPAAAAKKDVKPQNVAKKVDKKKKKKKKKSKVLGVPESSSDESDDTDIAKNQTAPAAAAAPLAFSGAAAPANPAATSLSEWEQLLLATPNSRETTRFIGLFQTKQITAEIFYGIVGQMLNDGRSQMRQLGVMALAATLSLESYEMLVAAKSNEHGVVKTQATRYLDETYSRPQAIRIIYDALTKDVAPATQLQALKNLSAIITNISTVSIQTDDQPARDTAATPVTAAATRNQLRNQQNVREYFRRIQQDAMPRLLVSKDAQVRTLAQTVTGLLVAALNSPGQVAPVQTASTNP